MNLNKLFELQRELDERIVKEKGLEGQDLLPKKILALQVELGELANEWRGFKFWSKNQEPRREVKCHACKGTGRFYFGEDATLEVCGYCEGTGVQERDPLLEEYVDCLHFILSIGLGTDFDLEEDWDISPRTRKDIISMFNDLFHTVYWVGEGDYGDEQYHELICDFLGLGKMLGFTWELIEQAYLEKNQVNHARQENGY